MGRDAQADAEDDIAPLKLQLSFRFVSLSELWAAIIDETQLKWVLLLVWLDGGKTCSPWPKCFLSHGLKITLELRPTK
eukprot:scaffold190214_cov15-Tisochrysis_lutea.AAC.1